MNERRPTLVYYSNDAKDPNKLINYYAKKHSDKMNYVVLRDGNNESKELIKHLGLKNQKEFRILHFGKKNIKFQINASTSEELENQIEKYEKRQLDPYFLSGDVPSENDGLIKTVV